MTMAMDRLHRRLPSSERYPLPPREITEAVLQPADDVDGKDLAIAAHFAFGSVAGALMASSEAPMTVSRGIVGGLAVWSASYLGWIPATGILRPANSHPARRTALMIAVHLVWGAVTAVTSRELNRSGGSVFANGPALDRPAR